MAGNLKFSNDVRKSALALRIKVQKVKDSKHSLPTAAHKELDSLLQEMIGYDKNEIMKALNNNEGVLINFANELKITNNDITLSGSDIIDAVRGTIHNIDDAQPYVDQFKQIYAAREKDIEGTKNKALKKRKISYYNYVYEHAFSLHNSISENTSDHDKSNYYNNIEKIKHYFNNDFDISEKFVAERANISDNLNVVKMWKNGYEFTSPFAYNVKNNTRIRQNLFYMFLNQGLLYLIKDKENDNKIVGSILIHSTTKENVPSLGWHVDAKYRNQGIATQAAKAFITELFQIRGFENVQIDSLLANKPTLRILEKLGFEKEEGYVEIGTDNDWIDMTISREKWFELHHNKDKKDEYDTFMM